jgi:diguanylate cyclase (GGDEF)-like protein
MPTTLPPLLNDSLRALKLRWEDYRRHGGFDQFVEFTVMLNSIAVMLESFKARGLARQFEGLEAAAMSRLGNASTHPIGNHDANVLERQLDAMLHAVEMADARRDEPRSAVPTGGRRKPHVVWMIADAGHPWVSGLTEQLSFFGFGVCRFGGNEVDDFIAEGEPPRVVLFIPGDEGYDPSAIHNIKQVRASHPASHVFCLSVPKSLDAIVALLRAGASATIQPEHQTTTVLSSILELVQSQEHDPHRVLIVEDSPTAVAHIQRSLTAHGINSRAISGPKHLIGEADSYRPDLVLMDMYMPDCTGVEATRVLRQIPAYQSLPIVYLSSETSLEMQVEALRLGGDQFLTKPINPVLLAAVVETKIERYREMQRSTLRDGLTGLLHHSAAKTQLDELALALGPEGRLCVLMLDIDHFKSVNDTYGHPVGDQVIRGLAWLLKGRLRGSDIIGRYGGEEFLIGLPDIDIDKAYNVIDLIRRDFASLPHACADGALRATFSAGIAAYTHRATGKALIHAADDALLAAKRLGRNRVERADMHPKETAGGMG